MSRSARKPVNANLSDLSPLVTSYDLNARLMSVMSSCYQAFWSVAEHDRDKLAMEAQLRGNLDAMLDVMWRELVEDTRAGVTAVVQHMSTQIEQAVFQPPQVPLTPYSLDPAWLF